MNNVIATLCGALATVGTFVVLDRIIRQTVYLLPWPLIASALHLAVISAAAGLIAGKIAEKQHAPWVGLAGAAVGMIFVISVLGRQIDLPFDIDRNFVLLATLGIPAIFGALIAAIARKKG
jgi:NADH:ubiquinone oxidoreductase subunit H